MPSEAEPTRQEVDAISGDLVLEFGSSQCGICQRTRPLIDQALAAFPQLEHRWIEDGKGKALGRSFGIKLWPTLVFLRDGSEVKRLIRPGNSEELNAALSSLLT